MDHHHHLVLCTHTQATPDHAPPSTAARQFAAKLHRIASISTAISSPVLLSFPSACANLPNPHHTTHPASCTIAIFTPTSALLAWFGRLLQPETPHFVAQHDFARLCCCAERRHGLGRRRCVCVVMPLFIYMIVLVCDGLTGCHGVINTALHRLPVITITLIRLSCGS